MPSDRKSLFCSPALAERIERAEVDLISAHTRAAHRRRGGESAGFLNPLAGGAASFADDGSPYNKVVGLGFAGAATAPQHRRNGIQTALLTRRLTFAAAAGCDIAVMTTQPGSKSHQNSQRRGFDLLYTRVVLVKHPRICP